MNITFYLGPAPPHCSSFFDGWGDTDETEEHGEGGNKDESCDSEFVEETESRCGFLSRNDIASGVSDA